jgi:hypothetical protein
MTQSEGGKEMKKSDESLRELSTPTAPLAVYGRIPLVELLL